MRVSVVIPVYNGADLVAEAIRSAWVQTVAPAEVIVVNDGSTDGSADLLADLSQSFALTVVNKANGGEASARNAGLALASGEFVAFLDHDDLWHPRKLERQSAQLEDPDLDVSFTATDKTVRDWNPEPEAVLARLYRSSEIPSPSAVLVRRKVFDSVPPFEQVRPFGDDWLMWLHMARAGFKIAHLPERLTEHRLHGANMSASEEGYYEAACQVFGRFGDRQLLARWHLMAAIDATKRNDRSRARRHIVTAARTRPLSIRPGWARILA